MDCDMKEIRVSVMHRSGAFWKWPRPVDSILCKWANVVKKICLPEVTALTRIRQQKVDNRKQQ